MKQIKKTLMMSAVIFVVAALSGCQSLLPKEVDELTACPDKRPQMCSMQYQPVCAYDDARKKLGTFSNGCAACSESRVMGYVDEACGQ